MDDDHYKLLPFQRFEATFTCDYTSDCYEKIVAEIRPHWNIRSIESKAVIFLNASLSGAVTVILCSHNFNLSVKAQEYLKISRIYIAKTPTITDVQKLFNECCSWNLESNSGHTFQEISDFLR